MDGCQGCNRPTLPVLRPTGLVLDCRLARLLSRETAALQTPCPLLSLLLLFLQLLLTFFPTRDNVWQSLQVSSFVL